MPERFRHDAGPPDFNEQVTVNSEQVSVGRGVPPSRQHERNTNMNDTTKSKAPRATDERFVARGRRAAARGRRAYWENGRLVRSMDGPCAAPATGGTPVVPVGGSPRTARPTFSAAKMAAVPVKAPRASTNWDSRLPGGGTGQNEITVRMKSYGHEPRATSHELGRHPLPRGAADRGVRVRKLKS